MSVRALIAALALAASPAAAHDFWLQPETFQVGVGTVTPMTLQVGHGAERQRSQIPSRRVLRFGAIGPDGTARDLRGSLTLGSAVADGALVFDMPGAHLLMLESDNGGRSHLSADRFRAYAEEEGLTPALRAPRKAESSERYSRNAKAVVQVGDGSQAQVTRPVGLPLEIVPDLWTRGGAALPVRVFHRGRPLPGALVKLTDLDRDAKPLEMRRTDAAGRASFTVAAQGRWRLNVVWTQALPPGADADFETVFSSLSFATP